jgi:uncharacterized protein
MPLKRQMRDKKESMNGFARPMRTQKIRYPLLILIVLISALLLIAALSRLKVNTDVAASLPEDGGILSDAVYIFKNHPIQNEIAIDIATDRQDKDFLVLLAAQVEQRLRRSGLFTRVGMQDMQQIVPQLIGHTLDHLPFLFSARELETQIAPLISAQAVEAKFKALHQSLMGFESIGQAGMIARDPLGFRELKLSALAALAPSQNVQIYRGQLLSADGRHLMLMAQPSGSGTDTVFARRLTDLMNQIEAGIKTAHADFKGRITLTPVGAYRAALDNETMVRRDVNKAIFMATLGIAALLLLAFPRPLVGLLALLPALAGTTLALFAYSLLQESISIMALGFGGAVISITVDHGIAYLLFLDRPHETSGKQASREVWAVGLLAVLTTIGAFLVLSLSGFPIFKELGIFTAMGIAFSFLFVHIVFPRVFPSMPPARTSRNLPLQRWADGLANLGVKGSLAALLAFGGLIFWAKPHFNVNLSAMNSVSQSTQAAESLFSTVWGNIFSKSYLICEAPTMDELQKKGDRLLAAIEKAQSSREIESAFVASRLFPGPQRRRANYAAWQSFWSPGRAATLRTAVSRAAVQYGFNARAFEPFIQSLTAPRNPTDMPIDPRYQALMGIYHSAKDRTWRQVTTITAGPEYDGAKFYAQFSGLAKVFDARLFSDTMGRLLFKIFSRMLLIIGISVVMLLLLFYADWQLTLISLLPMAFAFVCTLGSLRLMGRDLDIPALMLAIIVLGMGIDYSLFFVCSYQRYQTSAHPNFSLIRMSIFMASVSTLIGFGVLCGAKHPLLKSAGISSSLGIGFSMMGAFLILPPILQRRFARRMSLPAGPADGNASVLARYRNLEPYPRFFARFKLKLDPMFKELQAMLPPPGTSIRTILDIGSGYGIPACWLLQRYPDASVFGIEPGPDRVRVANFALGNNGQVDQGLAPQMPDAPQAADAAFMLDMCHFLDDDAFKLTLARLHDKLRSGGFFYARVVLGPNRVLPWTWWLENMKMKLQGCRPFYRSLSEITQVITDTHFEILATQSSGKQNEMAWVVARR